MIRLNYFKKVHSRQKIIFGGVTYGNEEIKRGKNIIFSIEYGMIYSTRHYKAMIDKEFFSEYIKEVNIEKRFRQIDYLYYYDKDINI